MEEQVNPLEIDHSLCVVLPGGVERNATVHGSKPVMDLLVTLCASYHLNPSDYTVEVLSPNKNNISFKPNSPIGSLEAEKIVLKPKGMEEKIRKPYMPEASVRLLINYNRSHKAVVRVNPRVPLEVLQPAVCGKCEFPRETTVLLRDSRSREPLDLSRSLNELGLREVYAVDTAEKEPADQPQTPDRAVTPIEVITPPPLIDMPKKKKKQKENTGFLSLFRRRKKKSDMEGAGTPPVSPGLKVGVDVNVQGVSSYATLPTDMPKKRRAPQPPMGASQSVPNDLGTCHLAVPQGSADSTLRRTKRRAPPPPCVNAHQELHVDTEVKVTGDSLKTVEELRESDESDSVDLSPAPSSYSSPNPSHLRSSSPFRPALAHLHDVADPYLPSLRGKDLLDARSALAKVLTTSFSKGALVKRLRSSATFPKSHQASSFTPTTRRCSDNGVFSEELESVLGSKLPTEAEWEDPAQRRGMTTFKVVPLKKQKSEDPEITQDAPDGSTGEENYEGDASPEVGENQTEDLSSPDSLEAGTPPQSPEPSSQETQPSDRPDSPPTQLHLGDHDPPGSPLSGVDDTAEEQKEEDEPETTSEAGPAALSVCSDGEHPCQVPVNTEEESESARSPSRLSVGANVDQCDSGGEETDVEEDVQQEDEEDKEEKEEDSFPPPPPPVFFSEDIEDMEDEGEDPTASPLTSSQPQSPTSTSEDHQSEPPPPSPPPPAAAAPRPVDETGASTSRFAQAVALAVQRSRLQGRGKGSGLLPPSGPHITLPSPTRTTYQYGA